MQPASRRIAEAKAVLCLVATALSASTGLLELAALGPNIGLCVRVWDTWGWPKVLDGLATTPGASQQQRV